MVRMECWWQVESKFDTISNSLASVGSDVVMVKAHFHWRTISSLPEEGIVCWFLNWYDVTTSEVQINVILWCYEVKITFPYWDLFFLKIRKYIEIVHWSKRWYIK
jgi:hypothetical protein